MKSLLITLICVAAIVGVRQFVAPVLSMKAIGEARRAVRTTYNPPDHNDTVGTDIADAVEASLHRSHRAWRIVDLVLDVMIVVVALAGLLVLRKQRQPGSKG